MNVPEIDVSDPGVLNDPFTAYGKARDQAPLARLLIPGMGTWWVMTRYDTVKAMLADPRFELSPASFMRPSGIPERYLPYMRTLSEMDGPDHHRLRRLVAPAFTPRRAEEFRPRIVPIVDALLDEAPQDLVRDFAQPLPMDVICEFVGIPREDRPQWREYGAAIAAGHGPGFAEAIPGIMDDTLAAVARRREEPADDLVSFLIQANEDERLTDTEIVSLVWHLVLAGQTPANLITNAVELMLTQQIKEVNVDELMRFCSPQLLTAPRYATQDVELEGVLIRKGDAVTTAMVAANRDPRVFEHPDTFDVTRQATGHVGFGHGPHFCLGAALARVETEVALTRLFDRFPSLRLGEGVERTPDGGTWRLTALPVKGS